MACWVRKAASDCQLMPLLRCQAANCAARWLISCRPSNSQTSASPALSVAALIGRISYLMAGRGVGLP